jgi:leucyl aminopeptidase
MVKLRFRPRRPKTGAVAILVEPGAIPKKFRAAAQAAGFTGDEGETVEVLGRRHPIIVAGLGASPGRLAYEAAGAAATAASLRHARLSIQLEGVPRKRASACLTGALLRAWRYDKLRTVPDEDAPKLQRIDAITDDPRLPEIFARWRAAIDGTIFARDLVTEPPNTLTPASFIEKLVPLRDAGVTVEVLSGPLLRAGGFGGLLAVGGGSANKPALVILRWEGSIKAPPVAFVGKGITFDTGGICVKPADKMWEMKADMAGAAACAGAMLALAKRKSPAPAIAVLALAENALSYMAYRPGDVIKSFSGRCIEVVDTDAEGRLVLMDALAWAAAQKPAAIIDFATLTGSIVVALGHHQAGMFTNNPSLASSVAASGARAGEPAWHMPIDDSHRRELDSEIADLRHCSPERMQPDACQAAAFLREFAGDTPWVHLDIAGVENREEADARHPAGATGFGVRLLDRLMRDRFEGAEAR